MKRLFAITLSLLLLLWLQVCVMAQPQALASACTCCECKSACCVTESPSAPAPSTPTTPQAAQFSSSWFIANASLAWLLPSGEAERSSSLSLPLSAAAQSPLFERDCALLI